MGIYRNTGKRVFDFVVASSAAALLAPVFAGVAIAVRVGLGAPVLFKQKRAGLGGRIFEIRKFRSMTDARGPDGSLLPDSERLTALGRFLRKTSLDELPELWNVVTGDMSLVGPRPLLEKYVPLYTAEQARRHEVRPGLTGWAAIHGRNTPTWEERFARDVWYVDHLSFALDLHILWRTVALVLSADQIDPVGVATMPEFTGSAPVTSAT